LNIWNILEIRSTHSYECRLICDANCLTCMEGASENKSFCLSCYSTPEPGLFLNLLTNICVTTCPDTYFNSVSSRTCESCLNICSKCV
jgi:proprotein convertase subtilisin/kexin type 5